MFLPEYEFLRIWISNAVEFDSSSIMRFVIEFVSGKSCDVMDLEILMSTLKRFTL